MIKMMFKFEMILFVNNQSTRMDKFIILTYKFILLLNLYLNFQLNFVSSNKIYNKNFTNLEKSSKFFPLFSIVRIANTPCVPDAADTIGTCFTRSQCTNAEGIVSGTCSNGFGVCCITSATCDATVTHNNTNFRSRDSPQTFVPSGLEVCNVRIQRTSQNICQIRLDIISMQIDGPDVDGQCMVDSFSINGVTFSPPNICGNLGGQHMYLDYGSSDRITLSIITDGAASQNTRNWNIRISYLECNSLSRAPDGCLQYYTAATGEVRMLGYPMAPHLADLDYTVCVRTEDGAGSIVWTPCAGENPLSRFLMSGAPPPDIMMLESPLVCDLDYVLIMTDDLAVPPLKTNDRYCGSAISTLVTTAPGIIASQLIRSIGRPFIMRVKTDGTEPAATDTGNTGFCLAFRQEPPSRG